MSGFIQPAFVVNMLAKPDVDGFNDRQLFDCPPEVDYKYEDLKVPMDTTHPSLTTIFRIIRAIHSNKLEYTMSDEAINNFITYHDTLVERKQAIPDDENRRGVLSKAKGQFARLALVVHVLNQAVDQAQEIHSTEQAAYDQNHWCTVVGEEAVACAEVLMNHFIEQKFCLMPPEVVVAAEQNLSVLASDLLSQHPKVLKRFLTDHSDSLTPSDISRRRLQPPKPLTLASPYRKSRYLVEKAKEFIKAVAETGFGTIEQLRTGKRSSGVFRKRRFSELDSEQTEILQQLKVSRQDYESSGEENSVLQTSSSSSVSVMSSTPETSTSSSHCELDHT